MKLQGWCLCLQGALFLPFFSVQLDAHPPRATPPLLHLLHSLYLSGIHGLLTSVTILTVYLCTFPFSLSAICSFYLSLSLTVSSSFPPLSFSFLFCTTGCVKFSCGSEREWPSNQVAGGRVFWVRPAWLFVCNAFSFVSFLQCHVISSWFCQAFWLADHLRHCVMNLKNNIA